MNWELENQVWSRVLHKSILDPSNTLSPSAAQTLLEESSLLVSMPICAPSVLVKDLDENVLEKWGFQKMRRMNPGQMAGKGMEGVYKQGAQGGNIQLQQLCAVVVDSGYSFTHVMPVYQGKTLNHAVKRSGHITTLTGHEHALQTSTHSSPTFHIARTHPLPCLLPRN